MSFWRQFGKDLLGDVRQTIVTTLLTLGSVGIGGSLLAAITKAIKSEPVPWTIFFLVSAVGIVLLIVALVVRKPSVPDDLIGRSPSQFDLNKAFEIDALAVSNLQNRTEQGRDMQGKAAWSLDCEISIRNRHPTQGLGDVTFRIIGITPPMSASPSHHPRTQDTTLRRVQFSFTDIPPGKALLGDTTGHVRIFNASRGAMMLMEGGIRKVMVGFFGTWPDNLGTEFAPNGKHVLTVEVTGSAVTRQEQQFLLSFSTELDVPVFSVRKMDGRPPINAKPETPAKESLPPGTSGGVIIGRAKDVSFEGCVITDNAGPGIGAGDVEGLRVTDSLLARNIAPAGRGPRNVPPTTAQRQQLADFEQKLVNSRAKGKQLVTTPESPGFDIPGAILRDLEGIDEIQAEITRLEGEQRHPGEAARQLRQIEIRDLVDGMIADGELVMRLWGMRLEPASASRRYDQSIKWLSNAEATAKQHLTIQQFDKLKSNLGGMNEGDRVETALDVIHAGIKTDSADYELALKVADKMEILRQLREEITQPL